MKKYFNHNIVLIFILFLMASRRGISSDPILWLKHQLIILPGIIIGLTFHEWAHAASAVALGDNTPKNDGRLSISPFAHLDLFGFVALMLAGFGWGKPVAINSYNFKNRRRSDFIVSISGVTMNFFIALVFSFIYKVYIGSFSQELILGDSSALNIGLQMIYYIIYMNIVLMIFNLLPIPPLDGFSILTELFNLRRYSWYWQIYNNGFIILLAFIFLGGTAMVMGPAINSIMNILL